jgi:hypothetical protein
MPACQRCIICGPGFQNFRVDHGIVIALEFSVRERANRHVPPFGLIRFVIVDGYETEGT